MLEGGYSVILRGFGYLDSGDGVWRAWNKGDLENENFVLFDSSVIKVIGCHSDILLADFDSSSIMEIFC